MFTKCNIYLGSVILGLMVMLVMPSTMACDNRCQKASVRALKQYGGKIETAENKSCVVKPNRSFRLTKRDCEKAIKYLDMKYKGYSALIKSNPEIAEYRKRHLKLNDKLENINSLSMAEETKAMTNKSNGPFGLNMKKIFE